jgi:hypothetical protein
MKLFSFVGTRLDSSHHAVKVKPGERILDDSFEAFTHQFLPSTNMGNGDGSRKAGR